MPQEPAVPDTGYFRVPSIWEDIVVFVSEDDLWTVPRAGGVARRLTSNLGPVGRACISPDGLDVAFTGTEEHHAEVYVMPSEGGAARRLTYFGSNTAVRGWTRDGRVACASDTGQPFAGHLHLWAVPLDGGPPERLPTGPAMEISYASDGDGAVIGRHTVDPARWKRYRGGTRGDLWIDRRGDGTFRRLVNLEGNLASPMWVGNRIFFLSDHEGIGNLYSCRTTGSDVRRHTDHEEYYARLAQTDGHRIVYQLGAEIWIYDPGTDLTEPIEIDFRSPRVQRNRRFVEAAKFMHDFSVHPKGHSLTVHTRGKFYTMPLWEQAVHQYGARDGVRYRLAHWTHDAASIAVVSDEGGEEALEVYDAEKGARRKRFDDLDLGRALELVPSPTANQVALTNHRMELVWVDLDTGRQLVVDRSPYDRMSGLTWSPDGRWLAYSCATTRASRSIKLARLPDGDTHLVTGEDFEDVRPSFDPDGRYLYFLSYRVFDPVYDMLYFDANFPRTVRPHLVTLRADEPSPFVPKPQGFGEQPKPEESNDGSGEATRRDKRPSARSKAPARKQAPKEIRIDLDGIADRVVAFPMPEGRYAQVWGIKDKVFFTNFPVSGSLSRTPFDTEEEPRGKLEVYDLRELKHDTLIAGIGSFKLSQDGGTLVYRARRKLRAVRAGEKPDPKSQHEPPGRGSGWIDLGRIRVSVDPSSEWQQMYREAWRFQRQHFWVPDLSGVDWDRIYDRYLPLVDKVATRLEFSDLMWETLGELGTSHAYEIGGDLKPPPPYPVGHLGADIALGAGGRWTIAHIVRGDPWDPKADSPLRGPGLNVREGDTILAVNGQPVDRETSPHHLLVHQAKLDVELTIGDGRGRNPRTIVVRTLLSEVPARYREWVEDNRAMVHRRTRGRVGYVHIPNMGPPGYAEFHRYYRTEVERDALIVDVRFNGGGHVSQLLIEKLARERLGYDVRRWGTPQPYPEHSPGGPMVCLTNERAGSDGDIFTHVFKLKGLGPVVGKRTWGGVIGISLNHVLVDNGVTTQPEYSFWFRDVGWGVENYGTDPDYDIDIRPQDHVAGRDPQMEKALDLVNQALRRHKPLAPDMKSRPKLTLPKLPPRKGSRQAKRGGRKR